MKKYIVKKIGQGKAAELPQDEPVFVLRAQDLYAYEALHHYFKMIEQTHPSPKFRIDVHTVLMDFLEWRTANHDKVKVPD